MMTDIPGTIKTLYARMRTMNKRRFNIKTKFSIKDLKEFLDKTPYKILQDQYTETGDKRLRPTIDRINNRRGYSLDNLQVISSRENSLKSNLVPGKGRVSVKYRNAGGCSLFTELRHEAGLSIAEAARRLGISSRSLSNIETINKKAHLPTICKALELYNCDYERFGRWMNTFLDPVTGRIAHPPLKIQKERTKK